MMTAHTIVRRLHARPYRGQSAVAFAALLIAFGCTRGIPPQSSAPPPPGIASGATKKGSIAKKDRPKEPPLLKRGKQPHEDGKPQKKPKEYWVKVLRVIDGVTFALDTQGVVRLIGVTPPRASAGKTYRDFFHRVTTPAVRGLIEGKRVRLMRDKVIQGPDGRTLIYLFTEDRSMLNSTLIRKGYARVNLEVPFKFQDEFRIWQKEAKDIGLGFWGRIGN